MDRILAVTCNVQSFSFLNPCSRFSYTPTTIAIISTICVIFRPRQCLDDWYVHFRKDSATYLIMTLAWLTVQGWVLLRYAGK